jgi:hypothetical protein
MTNKFKVPLSLRIRPNSEAAPHIVEEVKELEKEIDLLRDIVKRQQQTIQLRIGEMKEPICYCIKCRGEWASKQNPLTTAGPIRFACEICGNKRCPHHSDHRLACTNSNEPGQSGSIYE